MIIGSMIGSNTFCDNERVLELKLTHDTHFQRRIQQGTIFIFKFFLCNEARLSGIYSTSSFCKIDDIAFIGKSDAFMFRE